MFIKLLSLAAVLALANGNCSPCPEIPKHYEELGCKGIQKQGDCCPERFECPDVSAYDKEKCHFKGKTYADSEELPEDVEPLCSASCRCLKFSSSDTASFNCANIECPDVFRRPDPGTLQQYSLDKCCSVESISDLAKIEALATCEYRGKTYREGERIYPENAPCYQCICNGEFDNSTNAQFNKGCKKIDCGIELRNLNRIKDGCVPVYFGDNGCCPIDFRCPAKSDAVMPLEGRSVEDVPEEDKCSYNNLKLARGQILNSDNKCITCTCNHPPMVECRREPNC